MIGNSVGKGENPLKFASDATVNLDSLVLCSYQECRREIPDETVVLRVGDNYFCSEGCVMFDTLRSGELTVAQPVRVKYTSGTLPK